jgi:Fe-S oxidoreductase
VNVFLRKPGSSREVAPLDIEKSEVFGLEKAADWTWKDGLDAFACMECGRCQDACPAFASGKPLSPKMILFNLEKHLLEQKRKLLAGNRDDLPPLFPDVHTEGEIWTCTTCGACQHVCPVEIEHIRKIVGVRQSEVLMQSRFPQELATFFRNMETNANPWGIGFSKRADWAAGLDVPLLAERGSADILLWVGCAGSYDEEGTQIARAMVRILKATGVDFAILGAEEKCCGDSARRLGQEYLFQTLAAENAGLFLRYDVKKILTFCPHGYNTFKNEYPKLKGVLSGIPEKDGERLAGIEVIPHVAFLGELIQSGRLKLRGNGLGRLTYHDSCYSGRHNGLLAEPREVIASLGPRSFVELRNNREHSFCCGAGGGLMWTDEKLGQRINHLRTDEVLSSGAEVAATSCPFCLNMLKDGLKDKQKPGVQVKDLAQLVAESLV